MPTIKGITTFINLIPRRHIENDRIEFAVNPSVDTPDAALRYIESRTNDYFQIIIDASDFAAKNPSIIYLKVWLMIDGVLYGDDSSHGTVGYVHTTELATIGGFVKKAKNGCGYTARAFRFRDVVQGDNGAEVGEIGEITVMLGRVEDGGPWRGNCGLVASRGGVGPVEDVAENCIIENDLAHTVKFGDPMSVRPGFLYCQLNKLDLLENPFATFTFRYRDRFAIQTMFPDDASATSEATLSGLSTPRLSASSATTAVGDVSAIMLNDRAIHDVSSQGNSESERDHTANNDLIDASMLSADYSSNPADADNAFIEDVEESILRAQVALYANVLNTAQDASLLNAVGKNAEPQSAEDTNIGQDHNVRSESGNQVLDDDTPAVNEICGFSTDVPEDDEELNPAQRNKKD